MFFIKFTLYGYGFFLVLAFITWAFSNKIDLGEEEIQEDEIENMKNNNGRWN